MVKWNHFLKKFTLISDTSQPVELAHCPTEVKDNKTLHVMEDEPHWVDVSFTLLLHISSLYFLVGFFTSLLCWGLWTVHSFVYWLILHQMDVFELPPNKTSTKTVKR